jgi:hypothetical protein
MGENNDSDIHEYIIHSTNSVKLLNIIEYCSQDIAKQWNDFERSYAYLDKHDTVLKKNSTLHSECQQYEYEHLKIEDVATKIDIDMSKNKEYIEWVKNLKDFPKEFEK